MEKLILDRLRESREVSIGSYRGYELRRDYDNSVLVYKNGRLVVSCENEKEAYEYIDDMPYHNIVKKTTLKYCIKVAFPDQNNWYYLCKDGHYKKESQVTKQNIRTFDSKNKAEQALKYSTKSLDCTDKKVVRFN